MLSHDFADPFPQVLLELDPLRSIFLYKIGARDRGFEIGLETQLLFQIIGRYNLARLEFTDNRYY